MSVGTSPTSIESRMDPKANEVDMKQFVEETMGLAGDTLGDQEALGRKMSWKEFETRSRMIRSLNQMPFEVLKQLWQAATAVEVMPDELLQPNDELTALICSGSVHLRKSNEHGTSDESRRDAAFYMAKGESFDVHKLYNMGIKAYGGEGGALTILINTKMWKLYRTRILSQHSERLENFLNSVLKFPAKRGFHPFKLRRVPGGTVVVKEGDPVDSMIWLERGTCSTLITFDETHCSKMTIPGRPSTPVVRFVRKLDQHEDVGSSVAFFADSKSKLQASRVLASTRSKHFFESFPKWLWTVCVPAVSEYEQGERISAESSLEKNLCRDDWADETVWQDEEEAYFVMIPLKQIRNLPQKVLEKLDQEASDRAAVWIRALKAAAIRDECDRLPSARSRSLKVSSSVPNSARLVKPDESRHEKEEGAVSSRSEVVRSKQTDLRNVPDKIPAVRSKNLFSPGTNSETRDSLLAPRTDNLLLVQGRTYEGSKASQ